MSGFGDEQFDRLVSAEREQRAEAAELDAQQATLADQRRRADEIRLQAMLQRAPIVMRIARDLAGLALANGVAPDISLYGDVSVSSNRERKGGAAPLKTVGEPIPAWRIGYRETDRIVSEGGGVGSRGVATFLDHNGTLHTGLEPWDVTKSRKGPADGTFGQYANLSRHSEFIIEETLSSPPELVRALSLDRLEADLASFAIRASGE